MGRAKGAHRTGWRWAQVRTSYESKPYRRLLMETWGATVHSSPSTLTAAGRAIREKFPDTPGSLGVAISEAVEAAVQVGGAGQGRAVQGVQAGGAARAAAGRGALCGCAIAGCSCS